VGDLAQVPQCRKMTTERGALELSQEGVNGYEIAPASKGV
jgi:hypothetical protein